MALSATTTYYPVAFSLFFKSGIASQKIRIARSSPSPPVAAFPARLVLFTPSRPTKTTGAFAIYLTGARPTITLNSSGAGDKAATWREAVAGCTAADDGFVYGGETGNVLTFVRKGRGGEGGGRGSDHDRAERNGGGSDDGAGVDNPALPDVLKWFWKLKHDWGVLAYEVAELEERRDIGSESGWEVIFASNNGKHRVLCYRMRCCDCFPLSFRARLSLSLSLVLFL